MTMRRETTAQTNDRLSLDGVASPTRVGLCLPELMPFQTWERIGRQISLISDASGWWLGDWLVYGEDKYTDRYKRAIVETSLDYQTLRNYAWVARKFKLSRRRDKLSLHHHAEVAALPEREQDIWLDRAEQFGWSKTELRRRLKQSQSPAAADKASEPRANTTVQLNVTVAREQRWQAAAASANTSLAEWITLVLDEAANQSLRLMRPAQSA